MENFDKFTKQMEGFWDKMNENVSKKEVKLQEKKKKDVMIPKPPPRISKSTISSFRTSVNSKKLIINAEIMPVKEKIVEEIKPVQESHREIIEPVKESYPEVTVIKSVQNLKSSETEESSSESESEETSQIELKPAAKPSVASTLGQHSLTRLISG